MKLRSIAWTVLALLGLTLPALPELIDPGASKYPLLARLSAALPSMDFLQSWESQQELRTYRDRVSDAERRVVAPLLDYDLQIRTGSERRTAIELDLQKERWIERFRSGAFEALVAVAAHGPLAGEPPSEDEFLAAWERATPQQRVFISYARADHSEYALRVQRALTELGYVVYVYRNDSGAIARSARVVGRVFVEAGQRFVIDSSDARQSLGVRFEADFVREIEAAARKIQERHVAAQLEAEELRQRALASAMKSNAEFYERTFAPERLQDVTRLTKTTSSVQVYGRLSCGRTRSAIEYLQGRGVAVEFRDIDKDASAASAFRAQRGHRPLLLPMIRVGSNLDVEYSTDAIDSALRKAGLIASPSGLRNSSLPIDCK